MKTRNFVIVKAMHLTPEEIFAILQANCQGKRLQLWFWISYYQDTLPKGQFQELCRIILDYILNGEVQQYDTYNWGPILLRFIDLIDKEKIKDVHVSVAQRTVTF